MRQKQTTPHKRPPLQLVVFFGIGLAISLATSIILGSVELQVSLAIVTAPIILAIVVRQNRRSRAFWCTMGHGIFYAVAMWVLQQPILIALQNQLG